MTETPAPGVSAVFNPPAPPPASSLTREQAAAQIESLKADREWTDRYLKGGAAELKQMRELTQRVTTSTGDLAADQDARLVAQREQQIATWQRTADLPPAVVDQLRNQSPVSRQEYDRASQEKARLMRDKEWTKKLLDGDREANTRWALVNIILGSRVA